MPSLAMVHANFAMSLASMTCATSNVPMILANPKGAYIHLSREYGVRQALKFDASHVMFIDTDISFPPNTLHRLLEADKDIVGCNYVRRTPPFEPLAAAKDRLVTMASGLFEVSRLPAGLILIKSKVFKKIPEPWFCTNWIGSEVMGEDYFFCDLARENGFELWMDTNLSLEIVHWSELGLRWSENGYDLIAGLDGKKIEEARDGKMEAA